jgi:Fe-S cluster assembly ATPase SufC
VLLLLLQADMAILDEIDSGLDIDALRDVAAAVNGLNTPQRSVLMVTHYRVRVKHKSSSSSSTGCASPLVIIAAAATPALF